MSTAPAAAQVDMRAAFAQLRRPARPRAGLSGWMAVTLLLAAELSGRSIVANGLIGIVVIVSVAGIARIRRLSLVVVPYLVYLVLSGVAVGSLPSTAHEFYTWLNGNGRIVIAVLPLVVLGTLRVRWPDLRLFVRAITVIVWADVTLLAASLAGVGAIKRIALHKSNFFGLTSSHHAAGYFASAAVLILFWARRTPVLSIRPSLLTIAAAGGLIVASGSRTSLLGLAGVAIWTLLSKRRASDAVKVVGATVGGGAVLLALGSRFSNTVATFFSATFRNQAVAVFQAGLAQHESTRYIPIDGTAAGYVANILARFFYWGTAFGLWARSPFLGIGSFRFNSINLQFSGVPYVLDLATHGVDNSAALAGAHDQYLETLVDNGVVGLVLLLMIWIVPYRRLRRTPGKPSGLVQSASQMVPFAFATAFTGLTLAAPSLTFIALTWLALSVLAEDLPIEPGDVAPLTMPPPATPKRRRSPTPAQRRARLQQSWGVSSNGRPSRY